MSRMKKIAVMASVACGALMLGAWNGPEGAPLYPDASTREMACDFEIHARNTGTHDIYLDLYTSRVKNHHTGSFRQLKIQNARVGANKIIPPQRVNVGGSCNAQRTWYIGWRASQNGASRNESASTSRSTRVSSSTGRRVLNLGDVGKW